MSSGVIDRRFLFRRDGRTVTLEANDVPSMPIIEGLTPPQLEGDTVNAQDVA